MKSECFADVLNSPFDEVYGHGTEVAGVVAGRAGPYLGAATGLGRLYSVKVFYHTNHRPDCNGGPGESDDDLMDAIDWVATKTPAMIVNLSLGSRSRQG